MKNTVKKSNTKNKTKKNAVKQCIETFVEKKIKYWTTDINKKIQKLENKILTKSNHKLLTELKKERKQQIKTLTKQYKLFNCNVNCKNTILEPGLSDQIPKSMHKDCDKDLIKMFNDQRKNIFNNKTNVLIDNFYEKTPNKIKNQLIKEGAISQCVPTTN